MNATLRAQQPSFIGNWEDLEHFIALAESHIRSPEREAALLAWSDYKLTKQAQYVRGETKGLPGKMGHWGKGTYIRSLTSPAIDLRGAVLKDICLGYADLRGVRFDEAEFVLEHLPWFAMKGAKLQHASLRHVQLREARLMEADLRGADLSHADLTGADLSQANLAGADLRAARLRYSNLERANLVGANLMGTDLCGSRVYGVSAWDVEIDDNDALRRDLIVTPEGQPEVKVDNIEVAQFVYLLLTNPKIRGVIDTVCKKGVLILGRFIAERKAVLDALRMELRRRGYVSIIFDFEKPTERDFTETVKTLAGLCRFIIADITNPKSSPLELQAAVPDYMVPLVPIIAEGEPPFAMFADLRGKYHWVLEPLVYPSVKDLIEVIEPAIIQPALDKHAELLAGRAQVIRTRHVSEYKGE
jgi:Pentapeptide repeats (8 copies)